MERDRMMRAFQNGEMLTMPIASIYGFKRFFALLQDDAILMDFSGVVDQNKQPIFEGDIVKVDYNFYHFPENQIENPTMLLCKFTNGAFNFFYKGIERVLNVDTTVYAVVGNIYQNPELINHYNKQSN